MCGRYDLHSSKARIRQTLDLPFCLDWSPAYNIAPGQLVPVIAPAESRGEPKARLARWGFRPSWAGADAPVPINARAEGLRHSHYFRHSFRHHRCIVPADGWYEWQTQAGRKQPWYFHHPERQPLALAGLLAFVPEPEAPPMLAIITEAARGRAREIHERMPLVLDPASLKAWLDPRQQEPDAIRRLVRRSEAITADRVSSRVNRADAQGPQLIEPVEPA